MEMNILLILIIIQQKRTILSEQRYSMWQSKPKQSRRHKESGGEMPVIV